MNKCARRSFIDFFPAALVLCSFVAVTGGCSDPPSEEKEPGPVDVTVVEVEARDTPVMSEFVAKTASSRRVEIRSRVEGFLEERLYTEGSLVEPGQPLFQMDRKPFEAQLQAAEAELSQQEARLVTAKANLDRVRPLAEQNAVAKKELDDALGTYRAAAAAVEAAKARVVQAELDLGYTTIYSPVLGLSSYADKREGAYVGAGTGSLLTYVAQIDPMWVEFSVSENALLKRRRAHDEGTVKEPDDGDYEVEVVLADGGVYPNTGRITFADASLSEATGTFLIRAEIENSDRELRPGMFVRAILKGAYRPDAILVPQRAVQQGAKGSFVWVVKEDGTAEFRPVVIGPWRGDEWFIEDGLQAGETVVVDGALKLRAGAPVNIVEPDTEAAGAEAGDSAPEGAGKGAGKAEQATGK